MSEKVKKEQETKQEQQQDERPSSVPHGVSTAKADLMMAGVGGL